MSVLKGIYMDLPVCDSQNSNPPREDLAGSEDFVKIPKVTYHLAATAAELGDKPAVEDSNAREIDLEAVPLDAKTKANMLDEKTNVYDGPCSLILDPQLSSTWWSS
eukprot:1331214-Amorphochlora_amoeboformis.AAC.1